MITLKSFVPGATVLALGLSLLSVGGAASAAVADVSETRAGNDCTWVSVPAGNSVQLGVTCTSLEVGYEARAVARPWADGPIVNETPWLQVAPGTAVSPDYGTVKGYVLSVEYRKIGG